MPFNTMYQIYMPFWINHGGKTAGGVLTAEKKELKNQHPFSVEEINQKLEQFSHTDYSEGMLNGKFFKEIPEKERKKRKERYEKLHEKITTLAAKTRFAQRDAEKYLKDQGSR